MMSLMQEWAHRLFDVPGRSRARRQTPTRRPPLQHKGPLMYTSLSSECGSHRAVKAIFWPWRSGESPYFFKVVPSSIGSGVNTVSPTSRASSGANTSNSDSTKMTVLPPPQRVPSKLYRKTEAMCLPGVDRRHLVELRFNTKVCWDLSSTFHLNLSTQRCAGKHRPPTCLCPACRNVHLSLQFQGPVLWEGYRESRRCSRDTYRE